MREQVNPSEDNKFYVAIAFGYVRCVAHASASASASLTAAQHVASYDEIMGMHR